MINTLERLLIVTFAAVGLVFVYGMLSMAFAETRVATPQFYQLMTSYPGTGDAVIAPRGPDGGQVAFYTEEQCLTAMAARTHPEDYFCLKYESRRTIDYDFPKKH